MTVKRGFTLIEVLVAVMLTGVLTSLALAPVMMTVRNAVDTQVEYSDTAALHGTLNFITRDLYSAIRLAPNVLAVKNHEALGGKKDDILMVFTSAPASQNLSAGTAVYKIAEGGILHDNMLSGLYRWVFPALMPNQVKTDTLNIEDGYLVLPDVTEFSVEVPQNSRADDNREEYSGILPTGLSLSLKRKDKDVSISIAFP